MTDRRGVEESSINKTLIYSRFGHLSAKAKLWEHPM